MKNPRKCTFLIFMAIFLPGCTEKPPEEHPENKITVHYIANEGFLLESNGTKVLIDGLFNTGLGKYAEPDSLFLSGILNSSPPFDDVDYLFFTHDHPDHFNDSLTALYLKQNPEIRMVCPSQVFARMNSQHLLDRTMISRIITIAPDSGKVKDIRLEKMRFVACRTRHGDTYSIENNAYILDFGEIAVFHSGDSWKEALKEWKEFDLKKEQIDLALVNGFYAGDKFTLLNQEMNPREIILIHIKNEHLDMLSEIMKKDTAVFHNAMMFRYPGESKIFYF